MQLDLATNEMFTGPTNAMHESAGYWPIITGLRIDFKSKIVSSSFDF
jgi:hypothetical protein